MKFRYILQFSFDRICRKIFWYLLSIVIGIMVLILIIFSSFVYFLSRSGELSVADTINGNIDSYGVLTYNSESLENVYEFVDAANLSDEILTLGDYELYAWSPNERNEIFNKLVDIQNQSGKPESILIDSDSLVAIYMDEYAFELCNPNLKEGTSLQNCEVNDNTVLVYLGYNFKEIPVGSSFEADGITYIVSGIIKKGEHFLYPDIFYNSEIIQGEYTFNTDSYVFLIREDFVYSNTYEFIASDGFTLGEAENKLLELADEYGLTDVTFSRMSDSIDWLTEQRSSIINITLSVFAITSISTVIIFMCFQLSSLWSDQNQFGVLLANGAGKSDLLKILLTENILRMLISLLLAIAFAAIYIKKLAKNGLSGSYYFYKLALYERAVPIGIFTALCVAVLSSIASMYFVRKQEPVQMIRSFRG